MVQSSLLEKPVAEIDTTGEMPAQTSAKIISLLQKKLRPQVGICAPALSRKPEWRFARFLNIQVSSHSLLIILQVPLFQKLGSFFAVILSGQHYLVWKDPDKIRGYFTKAISIRYYMLR